MTTFNGDSWSLIDKGVFYRTTFNFKMVIFNIYKNLFDDYDSFALPQKSSNFLWYFDGNFPIIICN